MGEEFPCKFCKFDIPNNDDTLFVCDLCSKWSNRGCLKISKKQYQKLERDTSPWCCCACKEELFFFSKTSFYKILPTSNQLQNTEIWSNTKHPLKILVQISQIVDGSEWNTSCDYYDLEDFNKIPIGKQDLALQNISSLHIDDLKTFLNFLNINVNIICVSESRQRPLLLQISILLAKILNKHLLNQLQGVQ